MAMLNIMHLNICGLAAKCDCITARENKADILCIVEHWSKNEALQLMNIQDIMYQYMGYVFLPANALLLVNFLRTEGKKIEACIAVTKNSVKNNTLYIIGVYRTPDSPIKEFLNELSSLLFQLYNKNDMVTNQQELIAQHQPVLITYF